MRNFNNQSALKQTVMLGTVLALFVALTACGSSSEELALAKSTQAAPKAAETNPPVLDTNVIIASASPTPEASPVVDASKVEPSVAVFKAPLAHDRVFGSVLVELSIPNVTLTASDVFELFIDSGSTSVGSMTGDSLSATIDTKAISNGIHTLSVRLKGASSTEALGKVVLNFQNFASAKTMAAVGGLGGAASKAVGPSSYWNLEGVVLETGLNIDNPPINVVEKLTPVWKRAFKSSQFAVHDGNTYGTNSGTKVSLSCSKYGNYRVAGIYGRSGDLVDKLGIICADQYNPSNTFKIAAYGGEGGAEFSIKCDAGQFVTQLNLRSWNSIDNVQIVCR